MHYCGIIRIICYSLAKYVDFWCQPNYAAMNRYIFWFSSARVVVSINAMPLPCHGEMVRRSGGTSTWCNMQKIAVMCASPELRLWICHFRIAAELQHPCQIRHNRDRNSGQRDLPVVPNLVAFEISQGFLHILRVNLRLERLSWFANVWVVFEKIC